MRPGNYGPGVGTCLEYEKISIVIVDDPLPADGRSLIINTSCQSTMQSCVAERAIGIRRQSMLEKVNKQKLVVIGNGMAGIRTVEVLLDRAPEPFRGQRHLDMLDAERLQRIDDGVGDRRRRADRASLAATFDPERVVRAQRDIR